MYRLLTPKPFKGLKFSQKFIQAKFKYQESINFAIEYYRKNNTYISNQHVLVKLIHNFTFDPTLSDMDIYKEINQKKNRLSSSMGFTSNVSPGHFHSKSFYTRQCAIKSMIYSDPMNIPHWKHIRAVRVLTHPHTTLKPVLAHLLKDINEKEYSVVGIDIPLLAVQYKNWFNEEIKRPEDERDNISDFITKWVLPGMLPEQIDISLRNCIQAIGSKTISDGILDINPPFYIQDWDNEFIYAYRDMIEFYNTGSRRLSEVMIGMPMFSTENYWESIPSGLEGLNINDYWITLLVYTDWIYPLLVTFDIDPQQELVTNQLMKVQRYIKGTHADKYIKEPMNELFEEKYNAIMLMWT